MIIRLCRNCCLVSIRLKVHNQAHELKPPKFEIIKLRLSYSTIYAKCGRNFVQSTVSYTPTGIEEKQ